MAVTFELLHQLNDVPAHAWNALTHSEPLLSHCFLAGLETTGCVNERTGWIPHHLIMKRDGLICAALPLYLKTHSRGEFVFDQGWAQAFERHGMDYYPKLLSAIPFTPVTGPRLLAHDDQDKHHLMEQALHLTRTNNLSSFHVLFPNTTDQSILKEHQLLIRRNVQFHWFNRDYADYEAFLMSMTQEKRKKIRQDSRKSEKAGISFLHLTQEHLTAEHMDFFFRCYKETYWAHGQLPYLNRTFFHMLREHMPEKLVLIIAQRNQQPVAAALNIRGGSTLYGRYWGALEHVPGLHFETCYMQGIRFCIEHAIQTFEGGAQGEHKLARGLEPVDTVSAHWVTDTRFRCAIEDFLIEESAWVGDYANALGRHTPFKKTD